MQIKKYSIDDIICIDETSINALQKRRHCYSEVGKRCTITTTSQEVSPIGSRRYSRDTQLLWLSAQKEWLVGNCMKREGWIATV